MTEKTPEFFLRAAALVKEQLPKLNPVKLGDYVQARQAQAAPLLAAVAEHGSPLYVIDRDRLIERARQFVTAFEGVLPRVFVFFAIKSNSHPELARILVKQGIGLDASSGRELSMALDCGAERIIFSGPGKTEPELELVCRHGERVTVMIDSFSELERLQRVASAGGVRVRAGVRLTTVESGIWRKFGIPIEDLPRFFESARSASQVGLCGIQYHLSWNMDAEPQVRFIARLGTALRELPRDCRARLEFLDVGGGFWPPQGEWLQLAATPEGMVRAAAGESALAPTDHYFRSAISIEAFAAHIAAALKAHLPAGMQPTVYTEPGRWLCNEAMHLLLTVVDRKAPDLVITDGGTNAVGWERFESDYFPIINLTQPALEEHPCLVAGSLCTPHDLWGYSYFGRDIRAGDILLVPDQGAYTYSLRQEFIKPLPKVVTLGSEARDSIAR